MATSDYTLNLLKRFEGYTAKPKWDHKQYSVGYSTRWQPGSPVGTREDHERALRTEAGKVDSYIDQNVTVPLDDNKRAALTSFGFNLGPGAIGRLLPDINAGNWDRVSQRMLSFSRAGNNPTALIDRRTQEAEILRGAPLPQGAAPAMASAPSKDTQPQQPTNEGGMLDLLAALGGSGSMGKLANAGQSNNIFGSLGSMFGGGNSEPAGLGGGQGQGNDTSDADMRLAQDAMKSAATGSPSSMPVYQKKPIDLANLAKILQQRSQLGAVPRQPGTGLGA